jgi:hypothetical protein
VDKLRESRVALNLLWDEDPEILIRQEVVFFR